MTRPPCCLALVLLVLLGPACGREAERATTTEPRPPVSTAPTTTAAPPPTTTAAPPPTTTEAVPPPARPFTWQAAGAFVWHETDVDPTTLGQALRDNGFGWATVFLHDGAAEDPVDSGWIERFRAASGLPLGGWGVLRAEPEREAELVDALLARYGLDFYVANAEADYEYSGQGGPSPERFERSARFVAVFRARRPGLFAGLSSYCRADRHDIDWQAWRDAGFAFLPQAYANDFGREATPAVCTRAARGFFPADRVHPTVGIYEARGRVPSASLYPGLLERAGTIGFSVYLAETASPELWSALGAAIAARGIAR